MLQMSLLIYAEVTLQFEWLEAGKAQFSWTDTSDQRHIVQLKDKTTGYEWRSPFFSADTFIIDDEEADDLPKYYKATSSFQGWSDYAGDNFEITLIGRNDASMTTYEIGQPYLGPTTHRQVTFTTIFPFYSIDPQATSSYKDTVANALNITSEDVSLLSYTTIGGGRLQVTTVAQVLIELADTVEANGGWDSRDNWRTICGGGNFTT